MEDPLAAASVLSSGSQPLLRDVPAAQASAEPSVKGSAFFLQKKKFAQQFAQLYYTRLNLLRPAVKQRLEHLQNTTRRGVRAGGVKYFQYTSW